MPALAAAQALPTPTCTWARLICIRYLVRLARYTCVAAGGPLLSDDPTSPKGGMRRPIGRLEILGGQVESEQIRVTEHVVQSHLSDCCEFVIPNLAVEDITPSCIQLPMTAGEEPCILNCSLEGKGPALELDRYHYLNGHYRFKNDWTSQLICFTEHANNSQAECQL